MPWTGPTITFSINLSSLNLVFLKQTRIASSFPSSSESNALMTSSYQDTMSSRTANWATFSSIYFSCWKCWPSLVISVRYSFSHKLSVSRTCPSSSRNQSYTSPTQLNSLLNFTNSPPSDIIMLAILVKTPSELSKLIVLRPLKQSSRFLATS